MSDQLSLSVVVPAFNEHGRVAPMLHDAAAYCRLRGRPWELIVVDDGSTDLTSALVREHVPEIPELRLIRLGANQGKGFAVRTGVLNARGERILFADADGATPMAELARLEAALDAGADVAIGSRALETAGVTVRKRWYRHFMGRAFHKLVAALTVSGYADTQCGFKLFRGDVAHDLFSRMRMNGFSFDVELLLMAERGGYEVAEVPVNWVHQPGSRINLVTDSLRMARDLFTIRANAVRGWYDAPHVARWEEAHAAPASAHAPGDSLA
jgi:dolichyl-phosphate beta-glucosyltransferase